MNIELRHLRYFVAVAEDASFTAAAQRVHVAQQVLSTLCPAPAEMYHARPGLVFVPSKGVPATALCVAWRADDVRTAVVSFVKLTASVAQDG